MTNAPCLNCTNRKLGCHSSYKEYKSYAESKTAENESFRAMYNFPVHKPARKSYRSADCIHRHVQYK